MTTLDATAGTLPSQDALSRPWRRRLPLLPALLFTIVVTQVPFALNIYYSLTDWTVNPPTPRQFVGGANYRELVGDEFFRQAAVTSIVMTVSAVLGALALGTLLAILLDRAFFGQGIVRTLLITPFLIMPVVAGLIWKNQMFSKLFGVVNWGLERLSLDSIEFVSNHPTFSIVTVLVWQWTPFMMLIILAGLQSQPSDIIEAARVDGATPFGIFRQLTLPHLRRYLELGALLGSIYIVQAFDAVDQMTGGGPGSTNIPYFVYQESIGGGFRYGSASAYAIVVVVFAASSLAFVINDYGLFVRWDGARHLAAPAEDGVGVLASIDRLARTALPPQGPTEAVQRFRVTSSGEDRLECLDGRRPLSGGQRGKRLIERHRVGHRSRMPARRGRQQRGPKWGIFPILPATSPGIVAGNDKGGGHGHGRHQQERAERADAHMGIAATAQTTARRLQGHCLRTRGTSCGRVLHRGGHDKTQVGIPPSVTGRKPQR